MSTFDSKWQKLKRSKQYREEFALAFLKRMVPFQIRAIRKKREWRQALLAEKAQLTQGVISRAEDPSYGNLTLNTIGRIAAGFDLAFVGRFVTFSELAKLTESLSEREVAELQTFDQEDEVGTISKLSRREVANSASGEWSKQNHKLLKEVSRREAEGTVEMRVSKQTTIPENVAEFTRSLTTQGMKNELVNCPAS